MEIVNATKMKADYTMGLDPDGREHAVVAIKGTFEIPASPDQEPVLSSKQVPLVMADTFTGQPGFSATVYESDFPLIKPKCDVLLNGSAYAPRAEPCKRVTVSLAVGPINKSFDVVGNRVWEKLLLSVTPSEPQPFLSQPISYDRAYGGVDKDPDNPDKIDTYILNPVGVGHYSLTKRSDLVGKPLPNTVEVGQTIKNIQGKYQPMSFGPIRRNFPSRVAHAGTYDQNWIDNVFPFLPADFNPLYYQSAPPDQQMDHPKGGEQVTLINLTPQGHTTFKLPTLEMPVEFTNADFERTEVQAVIDTLIIEPDQQRFILVWRASHPLKRNLMEIQQAVIGRMPRGWYRARDLGKTYFPSLAALVKSRQADEEDDS